MRPAVPRPPSPPRPIPPPFKHPRYAKRVSIGLAAIWESKDGPRIVLCADTRIDYGYVGVSDGNVKIGRHGYGWASILASDDWVAALALRNHMVTAWRCDVPPASIAVIQTVVESTAKSLMRSELFSDAETEMLLCGFVPPTVPYIIYLHAKARKLILRQIRTYSAIGSGCSIASVFLGQRDCGPHDAVDRTLYCVYEAKKYSERALGVGQRTHIGVLNPCPDPCEAATVSISVVKRTGQEKLEEI